MSKKKIVVLSGGLDSTVMLYKAVDKFGANNIVAVTFNYGQRHSKEIQCAKITTKKLNVPHTVVDMEIIGKQIFHSSLMDKDAVLPTGKYAEENLRSTVVPNRNMIMVSIATGLAISNDADEVWLGAHSGDHSNYPDCRPVFLEALRDVLNVCHFDPIKLVVPFQDIPKAMIVQTGIDLKVPFEDTWSCYAGYEKPCGECTTCNDRLMAFKINRVQDPVKYMTSEEVKYAKSHRGSN